MAISISSSPSVLVEEEGTLLTLTISSDEPIPEGGLELTVSSELENALGQFDVFAAQFDNVQFVGVNDNTSGFRIRLQEETGTITLPAFDDEDADSPLDLTFSVEPGEGYTVDENAGSVTLTIEDAEGGMAPDETPVTDETPVMDETPATDTPEPGVLQVSLFGGPNYLIEANETVSAHAFLATNGVIPEGGLKVFVDAPNLNEFDLAGASVEGGEIAAVRDGGFDLLMTEYTTLVNLPVADDGETEEGETATFSLAAGEGYEINEEYSSNTFNLVDAEADIPQGVISEPNQTIPTATDTQISLENPTFSGSADIYFDPGNRYLNENGTYTYIDYSEDVDVYKVELSAGETITIETFDFEINPPSFGDGLIFDSAIFDEEGNRVRDYTATRFRAAPDKLFGGVTFFDENENAGYEEFTAPEDGTYYVAYGAVNNVLPFFVDTEIISPPAYDPFTPGTGSGNRAVFGSYDIEIDLITEDNPRAVATPTPPVSNPNVTNPPTLSLSANPTTIDSEGNITNAVVEHAEEGAVSNVIFTIEAEGEIPEEGIEFVLNSDANLFDYVSLLTQSELPSTIGGQSLGAFYSEDGVPTGIRLLIEDPLMTVTYETANAAPFLSNLYGNVLEVFEPLETDGAEDVNFFLQPGEGYEIDSNAGTTEVTYYDSLTDVPASTGGGDTVPEVGVTISETELIETEGNETTITFTLSEPPPPEGLVVSIDSDNAVLNDFDVLNAEINGGNFPVPNIDSTGFFFTITEQTSSITVSAFDELTVDSGFAANTFTEGVEGVTFALQPQSGYTIDQEASEVNFTIADNPDSRIQVSLTASTEADPESNALIESEGTVGIQTFSLSAPPPEGGLTVSVSTDSFADFNLDTIEVAGGTITNLSDDGFDLTITEQEATVSFPILQDSIDEGSEIATFTLEPGDTYQVNEATPELTFALADTLDQVAVSREVESISTFPEANVLGLSINSPSVSISGLIGESFIDFPEDVDFYSFNLEAGQTVNLDVDTETVMLNEVNDRSTVYPALEDMLLKPDTELRLFDADGNELAANNDGAAPDEEFSRDPFIEYTATEAGTYYVGVSQLGNRNYDTNEAKSGSGWSFPEVGVHFGPYELTVSLGDVTTTPEQPSTEPVFGSLEGDIIEVTGTSQLIFGGDSDDLIDASISSTGSNRIYAGSGDDTAILGMSDRIVGGEGADKFFATSGGDNIITGGAGADQFWIATAETPDAANIITDFTTGEDVLGIAGLGIGFDDLSITQQDDNTLIAANGSDLAILQGIGADSLIADNFAFA